MPPTTPSPEKKPRMPLVPALEILRAARGRRAIVTSMGAAREWLKFPPHPLDLHYVPSTMGGVIPLGLGLALALPDREIVAIAGDGSLVMNLGALITVAAAGAANLSIVVLDNGVYEVTGGQATAGAVAGIDLAALGKAALITSVVAYDDLETWRRDAPAALRRAGPRMIVLSVEPVAANYAVKSPGPMAPRLAAFRAALQDANY
jgi:thiamine pyrophosphate-dependent acetolactate synthase large subunit-like protein